MERLGYTATSPRAAIGASRHRADGVLKPPGLLGIHTNMPATVPPDVSKALASPAAPSQRSLRRRGEGIRHPEALLCDRHGLRRRDGESPADALRHRGLPGRPGGLDARSRRARATSSSRALSPGKPGGLSRDDVLDNVTHYWLTNTGVSSARLYWESHLAFFDVKGVEIPVGVTVFPDELYPAPRSWAEKAYPKLVHYNRVEEGGHFAAWEQPQILSQELRDTFRSLR